MPNINNKKIQMKQRPLAKPLPQKKEFILKNTTTAFNNNNNINVDDFIEHTEKNFILNDIIKLNKYRQGRIPITNIVNEPVNTIFDDYYLENGINLKDTKLDSLPRFGF